MKPAYSRLCLEENEGNWDKAAAKFGQMRQAGQIPAEAWQEGRAP